MLLGRSSYHVNQNEGMIYSVSEIKGYYNNLTEKITRFGYNDNRVPSTINDNGKELYFSIAIFQYGLGAYDLYLMNNNHSMLEKTIACAEWAVINQQPDGGWITFLYENPLHPYSSMAQGEGISLLLRTYIATGKIKYVEAAKKAYQFMIRPLAEGGTTKYDGDDIYFYECMENPLILNGWIFSIWGVLDYYKFFRDEKSKYILTSSIKSLRNKLSDFDIKYWSRYEDGKSICSSFYNKLHIAQLRVMAEITGEYIFKKYADKWNVNQHKWINRMRAFIKKASQKLFE